MLPVGAALLRNPLPELGAGSVLLWHDAVAEFSLEFAQLLKPYAPNGCQISLDCSPVESKTLELSNTLLCHSSWLTFCVLPVFRALNRNPPPKLGVGRVPLCYEAVAELSLEFA